MSEQVARALRLTGRVKGAAGRSTAERVSEAADVLAECLSRDGRVYIAGNGGSAADAQHFAAEFTGRFSRDRRPMGVVALTTDTSALTAIANDFSFDDVFARQVEALGRTGDVFIGLSTSGNSENVLRACRAASRAGMTVIGMTGASGGGLGELSHIHLRVPTGITAWIQECHMSFLHVLCDQVELRLGLGDGILAAPAPQRLRFGDLPALRDSWRSQGLSVVSTNGCFDVLHVGHLQSLTMAASFGDVLVVLINSDDSVRRLKGPDRPIYSAEQRCRLLAALDPVDHVLVFDDIDPCAALDVLRPQVHCKGADYLDRPLPEADTVRRHGGRIEFLDLVPELSTSGVLARATGAGARP